MSLLRHALVGAVGTAAHYAMLIAPLHDGRNLHRLVAQVAATFLVFTIAFLAHRAWTF